MTRDRIEWIRWLGPDSFISSIAAEDGVIYVVFDLLTVEDQVIVSKRMTSLPGILVDGAPNDSEFVLWGFQVGRRAMVRRLAVDDLFRYGDERGPNGRVRLPGEQMAIVIGDVRRWIVDAAGRIRAIWVDTAYGEEIHVRLRPNGEFVPVHRNRSEEPSERVVPVAWHDDDGLIVLARAGTDTLGLHAFDLQARRVGHVLEHREDADIADLGVDPETRRVARVTYHLGGLAHHVHLEPYRSRISPLLAEVSRFFDASGVEPIDIEGELLLFAYERENHPRSYHVHDRRMGRTIEIGRHLPGIDRERLAPAEVVMATAPDGVQIEGYLTQPRGLTRPAPLVVVPHGGPFGVRDVRVFDPRVQYLASWGFAVLQVNFRGSGGFGLGHQEMGRRQWAKAIESDIEAAIDVVVARPNIDAERICFWGGSYGGFSALVSVARDPDRYSCAISLNGVMDVPLLYETSDPNATAFFERYVGELPADRARLESISPVYLADAIRVPVFLIYGDEDGKVPPEHAHRMSVVLEAIGRPPAMLRVEGMGHTPRPAEWAIVLRAVRRFLTAHLRPDDRFVPDPSEAVDPLVETGSGYELVF